MKTLYLFLSFTFLFAIPVLAQKKDKDTRYHVSERELAPFRQVKLSGTAHLFLIKGNTESIRIEVKDANLLPYMRAEIVGDILHIKSYRAQAFNPTINIYLTYKQLDDLQVNGKATIETQNTMELDRFRLEINGYAKTFLNLAVKDLKIDVAGYGIINLMGKADYQSFNLSGSGKVYASNLVGNFARTNISGWGNMEVNAQKELYAQVSGMGKVLYAGSPSLNVNKAGIGSVRRLD